LAAHLPSNLLTPVLAEDLTLAPSRGHSGGVDDKK